MKTIAVLTIFLLLFYFSPHAQVDTVEVWSTSMQKNIKTVVIKPANYNKRSSKKMFYPTVYLLHGYGGDHSQWIKAAPQLSNFATAQNCIIVCPDGGYNSWYVNSTVLPHYQYETFVSNELVNYIDKGFRTYNQSNKRAITGLSMGGHGALMLGIKHTAVFGAMGSICGGVDVRPFAKKWDLPKVLGDTIQHKNTWDTTMVNLLFQKYPPKHNHIIIDCGVDDFFIGVNRSLHEQLIKQKIGHEYTERPGTHNNAYWSNAIDFQLLFFAKFFNRK
jgi:S-formylglutathione hydrolase FrmB